MDDITKAEKSVYNWGETYISITFNENGTKKFYLLTKENVGKYIAIVVDKHIVSIPLVNMPITGGQVAISGDFTDEEIDRMIEKLNAK